MMSGVWRNLYYEYPSKNQSHMYGTRNKCNIPESLDHLERGDASCNDLADVMAREQGLHIGQEVRPLVREVARNDVLEHIGELHADGARWRGGEQREERGLQGGFV